MDEYSFEALMILMILLMNIDGDLFVASGFYLVFTGFLLNQLCHGVNFVFNVFVKPTATILHSLFSILHYAKHGISLAQRVV